MSQKLRVTHDATGRELAYPVKVKRQPDGTWSGAAGPFSVADAPTKTHAIEAIAEQMLRHIVRGEKAECN